MSINPDFVVEPLIAPEAPDTKICLVLAGQGQGRQNAGIKNGAFTLVELMVVLVIMGGIAAIAVPQYARSVEKSHRKDAENQLMLIYAAQQMYASRNNDLYWGPAVGGTPALKLANINQNLSLNILANGKNYDCTTNDAQTIFVCTAARVGGAGFTVTVTEAQINPGVNPSCSPVASCF